MANDSGSGDGDEVHASLLGECPPPEDEPFSFVPMDGLERLASGLAVDASETLVAADREAAAETWLEAPWKAVEPWNG